MVELDFKSRKIDLFHLKLRTAVSRSHSVRDKTTVENVYINSGTSQPEDTIESRSNTLKSFQLSRKSGNTKSTVFFIQLRSVILLSLICHLFR